MLQVFSTSITFVFLAMPIFSAIRLIVKKKDSVRSWIAWTFIISIVCYFLLLFSVWLVDMHFEIRLNRYDLNGDGMFSGAEMTPQMEAAMDDFTNDTGRSLAPITGIIISPIYSGFWHFVIGLPYILKRWSDGTKT